MAVNLNLAEVPPREKRLKSVLSFHGTASELKQKSEDGTLSAKVAPSANAVAVPPVVHLH